GLDAGDVRRRCRRPERQALRHPRARAGPGVHDRPDTVGRDLLHGPERRLVPPRPHVGAVPEGVTEFNTWREKTTVFHEGVPGHHLQCGQAVFARDTLNSWRRLACWVSGHGEGWALYAERLMADLGHLDDP